MTRPRLLDLFCGAGLALASALVTIATVVYAATHGRREYAGTWTEPEDGVQPWDLPPVMGTVEGGWVMDESGNTLATFVPDASGEYVLSWKSDDPPPRPRRRAGRGVHDLLRRLARPCHDLPQRRL